MLMKKRRMNNSIMNNESKNNQCTGCFDQNCDSNQSCCCENNGACCGSMIEELHDNEQVCDSNVKKNDSAAELKSKLKEFKKKFECKESESNEHLEKLKRLAAEFENYKKRTLKEKETTYRDSMCDVVSGFLPVIDNFERAIFSSTPSNEDGQCLKEGIEMVLKQMKDVLKNLGVEEIKCVGEEFDPCLHNAVAHVEDPTYGTNEVIEEMQKGYKFKDSVIRHSMVKVAN